MKLLIALLCAGLAVGSAAQSSKKPRPETFNGKARVATGTAVADVYFSIHIDQYTSERDITTMEQALQSGGSDAFLQALRRAPVAGRFSVGEQSFTIRWARQRSSGHSRVISFVTDAPVYFVGGGVPGAKPRAGFDVAVIRLEMDDSGVGQGSMAAAARVKPGGDSGVEIQDYADAPITLASVMRVISS